MAKADTCHCTDWDIEANGERLVATPSRRTLGKVLGVSALLLAIATGVGGWFGVPPGSWEPGRARREAERWDERAEQAERQAARVAGSAIGGGTMAKVTAENFANQAADARRRAEDAQKRAESTQATLGPVADAAVWATLGVLVLGALALPAITLRERITIEAKAGELRVRRRGQFIPSRTHHIDRFAAIAVVAERVVSRAHDTGRTDDHGWRWAVLLLPNEGDDTTRRLIVYAEQTPTLPPRVERLTMRVRPVVEFFQRATGLPVLPPQTADVSGIDDDWLGRRYRFKVVRHGPAETRPYQPLE